MTTDQTTDLEAIRQLKARYFRLMDTQQFDDWHTCFTDDVTAIYEGAPRVADDLPTDIELQGSAALIAGVRSLMTGAQSIHQGYMPEISLHSATTASGIWSMYDQVRLSTCIFEGWGHYHEDYVKEKGQWKIKKIHLTRLHTAEDWI
jgi:hypothetical protein